jgi:hypothetical protein
MFRHVPIAVARVFDRVFSWGMPEDERRDYLAESHANWEDMLAREAARRVLWRALKGTPSWLWIRMSAHDTTALPAALGVGLIAVAGVTASLQPGAYSSNTRLFMALASFGLLLGAVALLRTPRQLIVRRFRVPALAASVGIIGIGLDMPGPTVWEYETMALSNPMVDALTQAGLLTLGGGFAVGAIYAFFRCRRTVATLASALVMVGLALVGVSQIIWGIWDTSVDLGLAVSSMLTGLAALSLVHVTPRLRHLEIRHDI